MRPKPLTLPEFIAQIDPKDRWGTYRDHIEEDGLRIYIRKVVVPEQVRPGCDYELATLDAYRPGEGALTRFLDKYEPKYGFYVESLTNHRLYRYLLRRGYRDAPITHSWAPNVYKPRPGFKEW